MKKQLHLIIDIHYPLEHLSAIIQAGVTHVQLREKFASTATIIARGRQLKALLQPLQVPLLINDRIDIALCLDAHGVHLGQSDIPCLAARRLLGPDKIIGLTLETPEQAKIAEPWQLDYVGVGPVYATRTKLDARAAIGLAGLNTISSATRHPVIAIGGLDFDNVSTIASCPISGIAVSAAICKAKDPVAAVRMLSLAQGVYNDVL